MNDKIQSLYKNDVWRLVDKPRNQKIKKQMGIQKRSKRLLEMESEDSRLDWLLRALHKERVLTLQKYSHLW